MKKTPSAQKRLLRNRLRRNVRAPTDRVETHLERLEKTVVNAILILRTVPMTIGAVLFYGLIGRAGKLASLKKQRKILGPIPSIIASGFVAYVGLLLWNFEALDDPQNIAEKISKISEPKNWAPFLIPAFLPPFLGYFVGTKLLWSKKTADSAGWQFFLGVTLASLTVLFTILNTLFGGRFFPLLPFFYAVDPAFFFTYIGNWLTLLLAGYIGGVHQVRLQMAGLLTFGSIFKVFRSVMVFMAAWVVVIASFPLLTIVGRSFEASSSQHAKISNVNCRGKSVTDSHVICYFVLDHNFDNLAIGPIELIKVSLSESIALRRMEIEISNGIHQVHPKDPSVGGFWQPETSSVVSLELPVGQICPLLKGAEIFKSYSIGVEVTWSTPLEKSSGRWSQPFSFSLSSTANESTDIENKGSDPLIKFLFLKCDKQGEEWIESRSLH